MESTPNSSRPSASLLRVPLSRVNNDSSKKENEQYKVQPSPFLFFDRTLVSRQTVQDDDNEEEKGRIKKTWNSYDSIYKTSRAMYLPNTKTLDKDELLCASSIQVFMSKTLKAKRKSLSQQESYLKTCLKEKHLKVQPQQIPYDDTTFLPREWPRIPCRVSSSWKGNSEDDSVSEIMEFCSALDRKMSLWSEPVDIESFVSGAMAVINDSKSSQVLASWALVALIGFSIKVASPSLILEAASQCKIHQSIALSTDQFSVVSKWLAELKSSAAATVGNRSILLSRFCIQSTYGLTGTFSRSDAIASCDQFTYVYSSTGLYKFGSVGDESIIAGKLYGHNPTYRKPGNAEKCWVCFVKGSLYCKTSSSNSQVDRLSADNLEILDKGLRFGAAHDEESSDSRRGFAQSKALYPMLTDGQYLYVLKFVDKPQKIIPNEKKKPDSRKSVLVGDTVVRGEDWKWDNQDGGPGSLGVVVSIGKWGTVPNAGVSVKWVTEEASPGTNTYRWGVDGAYDLKVLEKPKLRKCSRNRFPVASASPSIKHRYSFILSKYDPEDLIIQKQKLPASKASKDGRSARPKKTVLTELHPHPLRMSSSKVGWVCDGELSGCIGGNSEPRFRCNAGCDYDLCIACMEDSMEDSGEGSSDSDMAVVEDEVSDMRNRLNRVENAMVRAASSSRNNSSNGASLQRPLLVRETTLGQASVGGGSIINAERMLAAATALGGGDSMDGFDFIKHFMETVPFGMEDENTWLEIHNPSGGDSNVHVMRVKRKSNKKALKAVVVALQATLGKSVPKRECKAALEKFDYDANAAVRYLLKKAADDKETAKIKCEDSEVANYMRCVSSQELETISNAGIYSILFDPVLLIAGSFFIVKNLLGIIIPTAMHSIKGHRGKEDACMFFDIPSGKWTSSVLAIPSSLGPNASSPACVNAENSSLEIYSSALNCIVNYDLRTFVSSAAVSTEDETNNLRNFKELGRKLMIGLQSRFRQYKALPLESSLSEALKAHIKDVKMKVSEDVIVLLPKHERVSRRRLLKSLESRKKQFDCIRTKDDAVARMPFCMELGANGISKLIEMAMHALQRNDDVDYSKTILLAVQVHFVGLFHVPRITLNKVLLERLQDMVLDYIGDFIKAGKFSSDLLKLLHGVLCFGIRANVLFPSPMCKLGFVSTTIRDSDTFNSIVVTSEFEECSDGFIAELCKASLVDAAAFCDFVKSLIQLLYRSSESGDSLRFTPVLKFTFCLMVELFSKKDPCSQWLSAIESFISECCSAGEKSLSGSEEKSNKIILRTLIPPLLSMIGLLPTKAPNEKFIVTPLVSLLRKIDSSFANGEQDYYDEDDCSGTIENQPDVSVIVESTHPYGRGIPCLKKTVVIPGAKAISITFDKMCRTISDGDTVRVYSGQTASSKEGNTIMMFPGGGPYFGKDNWPSSPVVVPGDTVTINFNASSRIQDDSGNSVKDARWGIKCFVASEVCQVSKYDCDRYWMSSLHRDLSKQVALTLSRMTQKDQRLKNCSNEIGPWAQSKILRQGACCDVKDSIVPVVPLPLYAKNSKYLKEWKMLTELLVKAIMFLAPGYENAPLTSDKKAKLFRRVDLIHRFVLRRLQVAKEWKDMVERKRTETSSDGTEMLRKLLIEKYNDNEQRLVDLCSYLRIPMTKNAVLDDDFISQLTVIVCNVAESNNSEDLNENLVFQESIDRLRLLLGFDLAPSKGANYIHWGDAIEYWKSIDQTEYPSRTDITMEIVQFVQAPVDAISVLHVRDLMIAKAKDRIAGMNILTECYRTLNSKVSLEALGGVICCQPDLEFNDAVLDKRTLKELHSGAISLGRAMESVIYKEKFSIALRSTTALEAAALAKFDSSGLKSVVLIETFLNIILQCNESAEDNDKDRFLYLKEALWMSLRSYLTHNIEPKDIKSVLSIFEKKFKESLFPLSIQHRVLDIVAYLIERNSDQVVTYGYWKLLCKESILKDNLIPSLRIRFIRMLSVISSTDAGCMLEDAEFTKDLLALVGGYASGLSNAAGVRSTSKGSASVVVFNNGPDLLPEQWISLLDREGDPDILSLKVQLEEKAKANKMASDKASSSSSNSVQHKGVRCDGCDQHPVKGERYKCQECGNFDLCSGCYNLKNEDGTYVHHNAKHCFLKIKERGSEGILQYPRADGGGDDEKSIAVGAMLWKIGIILSELQNAGHFVYKSDLNEGACKQLAMRLAAAGLVVNVYSQEQWNTVRRMLTRRMPRRALASPSITMANILSESNSSFGDKSMSFELQLMNGVARAYNQERLYSSNDFELQWDDSQALKSEMVWFCRKQYIAAAAPYSSLQFLFKSLEAATNSSNSSSSDMLYQALGALAVLGGDCELIRPGLVVTVKDCDALGIVLEYIKGSTELTIVKTNDGAVMSLKVTDVSPVEGASTASNPEVLKTTLRALIPIVTELIKPLDDASLDDLSLLRSELRWRSIKVFSTLMQSPGVPSILSALDNNIHVAFKSLVEHVFEIASSSKITGDESLSFKHYNGAASSFRSLIWYAKYGLSSSCWLRTFPKQLDVLSTKNSKEENSCPPEEGTISDYTYSPYAFETPDDFKGSSDTDAGGKLLAYWEKYVIPTIQKYVRGSFKAYEMDYFFAQLREPLREGNAEAAIKIAYTLCDGHIPAGVKFPDPSTDWSSLQFADVVIGGRYKVKNTADFETWNYDMRWTVGQSGVAVATDPETEIVLLRFINPTTNSREDWWFTVASGYLELCENKSKEQCWMESASTYSYKKLEDCNTSLISTIATHCLFSILSAFPNYLVTDRELVENSNDSEVPSIALQLSRVLRIALLPIPSDLLRKQNESEFITNKLSSVLTSRMNSIRQHSVVPVLKTSPSHLSKKKKKKKAIEIPSESSALSAFAVKQISNIGQKKTPSSQKLIYKLLHELESCLSDASEFSCSSIKCVSSSLSSMALTIPKASFMVVSFAIHPVLMDLTPGASLQFFNGESELINCFKGSKSSAGTNNTKSMTLPSFLVPSSRLNVKLVQGQYSRYKFTLWGADSNFNLASYLVSRILDFVRSNECTNSEARKSIILKCTLAYVAYISKFFHQKCLLPILIKQFIFRKIKTFMELSTRFGVDIAAPMTTFLKDCGLQEEMVHVQETELEAGSFYSTYLQELIEVLALASSLVEKSGTVLNKVGTLTPEWWRTFRRGVEFTWHLSQSADDERSWNRVPREECQLIWNDFKDVDLYARSIKIISRLPATADIETLKTKLLLYLKENFECHTIPEILYLPTDDDTGLSLGYAFVCISSNEDTDVMSDTVSKVPLISMGDATEDNENLMEYINSARKSGEDGESPNEEEGGADNDKAALVCGVCTFLNEPGWTACSICASPNANPASSVPATTAAATSSSVEESNAAPSEPSGDAVGWTCPSCTYINSWDDVYCDLCETECMEEPPIEIHEEPRENAITLGEERSTERNDDTNSTQEEAATNKEKHWLSVISFAESYGAGNDRDPRMNAFLRSLFLKSDKAVVFDPMVAKVLDNIFCEIRTRRPGTGDSYLSSCIVDDDECNTLLLPASAFSVLEGIKNASHLDESSILAALASTCKNKPRDFYQMLKSFGYDLSRLPLKTLPTLPMKEFMKSMNNNWSLEKDTSLLQHCKEICCGYNDASGVALTLSKLPVKLIRNGGATTHPVVAKRFRFLVLKKLNKMVADMLPLLNFSGVTCNRIAGIKELIFSSVKYDFIDSVMDHTVYNGKVHKANSSASDSRPLVVIDRMSNKSVFNSTFEQLSPVIPTLRVKRPMGASDPFIAFNVDFLSEHVLGEGGPYRQLFQDISSELQRTLFVPTANRKHQIGTFRDSFLPDCGAYDDKLFEFVGVLMGCCIRTGVRLSLNLPPLFWKLLVNQNVTLKDVKDVDVAFKSKTISDMTDPIKHVVSQIAAGISSVGIPHNILKTLFTWEEISLRISGDREIDIELLKRHTIYEDGLDPESDNHLKFFWKVLTDFNANERRDFVKFAWGQDRLPVSDVEFNRNHTRLLIKSMATGKEKNNDSMLPTADTCFFNIALPAYSSYDICKQKLQQAITYCGSMDADDDAEDEINNSGAFYMEDY